MYNTFRTATVSAKSYCTVAILGKKDFEELLINYPEMTDTMKKNMKNY